MSDKCDVDSDSDVSSNSSWTVLEETSSLQTATNNNTNNASQEENEVDDDTYSLSTADLFADASSLENDTQLCEINDDDDLQYALSFSEIQNEEFETDDKNELIQHGCLTFEEYLKNQTVNYDKNNRKVCFDEMPKEKQKSDKRKRRKCNAQSFGSLAIIGTVLAVAGVSFLCLLTPGNYSLTSSEIEKLKTECVPAKVLNNCNGSVPLCPVLCTNRNDKLAVVDEDCTIETCFKKNDLSAPRAKKYLKSSKQFKAVKTINLLDDENEDVKKENSIGPIAFEEFHKENRKYLNQFRKQEKKIKNILKKSSTNVVIKPKSAGQEDGIKSGSITPNVSYEDIKNNNNGEKADLKPPMPKLRKLKNQKIKVRAKQFAFNLDDLKNRQKEKLKDKIVNKDEFVRKINNLPINLKTQPSNKQEEQNKPNNINQNEENSFDYLTQSKIVCNILQDVMLLKMTSKLARSLNQKQEEVGKVKKKDLRWRKQNRSATDMSLQKPPKVPQCIKPSIREKQMTIRKLGMTSDTKLNLLDELPFSKRQELMIRNKIEANHLRNTHFDGFESHMTAIARRNKKEKSQFLNTPVPSKKTELACVKLSNDVECLKKKQMEFFEKLKKQQKERTEYLNLVRERQQQSIRDLIKERQFNLHKDASCGIYDVPIPNALEVHKKLAQLREKKITDSSPCIISSTTSIYPSECSIDIDNLPASWRKKHAFLEKCKKAPNKDKNEEMSKLLDQRVLSNPSFKKQMVKIPMSTDSDDYVKNQSKMNFKMPKEYMKIKQKYYERVGSYWSKREEYLTKRMEFMENVSDSIKEIVNLKKRLDNGKKEESKETENPAGTVMKIINEAIAVFPGDTGIKNLKSQMSFIKEKQESLKSDDEDKNSEIFEFTASDNDTTTVSKDNLYSSLFGKQGQHIKKRDMAIWYCNKISKRRKFCKDLTKHDMHRLNNNKKAKKEHKLLN
ncbi:hypothetical protein ILUMI_22305 [Ignelater luminosus]|uniref:Uncharacterized protein n=1 Tax=Ignelater luminosus TaxID=2038154 RepID=A0A8K0CE39_IGNLU|nr:hypothetical protein ILUMI_22305 [Ignelater luminosus]